MVPNGSHLLKSSIYFVAHRYSNHAGPSGYDRFADYLGERVEISPRLKFLGETALRLPTKLIGWYNGSFEYGRHDCVREIATYFHMRRRDSGIYHFLYAEKSLRFLAGMPRKTGVRIVGSFHHCPFKYEQYFRSTKHFHGVDHAVVVSRAQIPHLESIVGEGRVSFVPYGVDATYFVPASRRPERRMRCTCVGQHLRDFERLPSIIRGIQASEPTIEFFVIGAPSRFKSSLDMRNVCWKQGISDAEYLDILQQTDVLVLPLTDSTSVTTVNEALACGVPIVTNRGGVSDYLNEQCSYQFPVGDIDGMVEATVKLLRSPDDRFRMASAARSKGLEIDWPNSAANMARVYEHVWGRDVP